jgi:hypothetical protein
LAVRFLEARPFVARREADRRRVKYIVRRTRRAVLLVVVGCVPALSSCEASYPLEPTFCDDWCRALLRTECDQEPENCVRDCEMSRASETCRSLERELFQCYSGASDDDFVCTGEGFGSTNQPKVEVCRAERDALLFCEFPTAELCVDACRDLEAAFGDTDGPEAGACPPLGPVCETFCVDVSAALRREVNAAGGAPGFGTAASEAVVGCVVDRAASCYEAAAASGGEGGAPEASEWGDVLESCVGELN